MAVPGFVVARAWSCGCTAMTSAALLSSSDALLFMLRNISNDRTVALLDQRARDAPPTQLACEREPDGSTPDDEDGCFVHVLLHPPRSPLN